MLVATYQRAHLSSGVVKTLGPLAWPIHLVPTWLDQQIGLYTSIFILKHASSLDDDDDDDFNIETFDGSPITFLTFTPATYLRYGDRASNQSIKRENIPSCNYQTNTSISPVQVKQRPGFGLHSNYSSHSYKTALFSPFPNNGIETEDLQGKSLYQLKRKKRCDLTKPKCSACESGQPQWGDCEYEPEDGMTQTERLLKEVTRLEKRNTELTRENERLQEEYDRLSMRLSCLELESFLQTHSALSEIPPGIPIEPQAPDWTSIMMFDQPYYQSTDLSSFVGPRQETVPESYSDSVCQPLPEAGHEMGGAVQPLNAHYYGSSVTDQDFTIMVAQSDFQESWNPRTTNSDFQELTASTYEFCL
ncbi:hypothetical protein K435DRAFT_849726 [Dendrothele bispora CBS 962.96]|uniref:Zn(2)-C6 fungal-type domain-containing protein n=1 Tax=Dendrothele bispora (strain CBS 962.96) TaxID=1314807 RepID=A0A4S8MS01_DENBC|nr:hypothetical protein K435DRAFT_849726 [Dendrothele bispora CBS 962.96]